MLKIANASFDRNSAAIHFSYGDCPSIIDANDRAFEILGVAVPASPADKEVALRILECISMCALVGIALMCEQKSPPCTSEQQHSAVQGAFLKKTDGTHVDITCWITLASSEGHRECIIDFVENPEGATAEQERLDDQLVRFTARAFDLVLAFNRKTRTVTCSGPMAEKDPYFPSGMPLYAPDAFRLWVENLLDEDDWERARHFLKISRRLQHGEVSEASFLVNVGGGSAPFDVMAIGRQAGCMALFLRSEGERESPEALPAAGPPKVFIRTFGHFDVFVNGQAIHFSSARAREYLALLVDKRGGSVSSHEAAANMFDSTDKNSLVKCRKAASYLRKTLSQYGIEDIIESVQGSRRLVIGKVRCDLFEYFASDPETRELMYNGSYLDEYSWGEATKGEITFF